MNRPIRSGLPNAARQALQGIVGRLQLSHPERGTAQANLDMTDFSTLPSFRDLKMQRSLADLVGLDNPFFRQHEVRAGAETTINGRIYLNFSSYDYLGLNGHPSVIAAAKEAIDQYGVSASASRVIAGERPIHRALETALANHYGQEGAIVFVSGHATNVATISTLMGPKDLVIHDSLAHNSIVLGATFSGAERRPFPHNDFAALNALLETSRARYQRVLIVVEGLYSMDGDVPDLKELVDVKTRHAAWLMVDEAHSLGVLGPTGKGLFEYSGADPCHVDIWMGTLSKTLSACGGYIAGPQVLIDILKCTAGSFVYSVGLPPALAAASFAALKLLDAEPERVLKLQQNGALFLQLAHASGLDTGYSIGQAIIPIIVSNSLIAATLGQRLFERGINVQMIIPPAVPEKSSRLRFFVTSEHTDVQIQTVVAAIAEELQKIADGGGLLDAVS
jgi:8-amino-7-oxononanoate synthase